MEIMAVESKRVWDIPSRSVGKCEAGYACFHISTGVDVRVSRRRGFRIQARKKHHNSATSKATTRTFVLDGCGYSKTTGLHGNNDL